MIRNHDSAIASQAAGLPIKMMSVGHSPDRYFCLESARSVHSQSEEFGGGKIFRGNSTPPRGAPGAVAGREWATVGERLDGLHGLVLRGLAP